MTVYQARAVTIAKIINQLQDSLKALFVERNQPMHSLHIQVVSRVYVAVLLIHQTNGMHQKQPTARDIKGKTTSNSYT